MSPHSTARHRDAATPSIEPDAVIESLASLPELVLGR